MGAMRMIFRSPSTAATTRLFFAQLPVGLLALAVPLLAAACASDGGSTGCSFGAIESCACGDGSVSHRVCTDKSAWSPCACAEPDAGPQPDVREDGAPHTDIVDIQVDVQVDVSAELGSEDELLSELDGSEALDGSSLPDTDIAEELACTPSCGGRECGDDGCGGSCGVCACGHDCVAHACVFTACDGRACGKDSAGCGVFCGGCYAFAGSNCKETGATSACACQSDCQGRSCGDDGCGGSCGSCAVGLCNADGNCSPNCVPDCGGKACGAAPCEAFCGVCPFGSTCSWDNTCVECLGNADCDVDEICEEEICKLMTTF